MDGDAMTPKEIAISILTDNLIEQEEWHGRLTYFFPPPPDEVIENSSKSISETKSAIAWIEEQA